MTEPEHPIWTPDLLYEYLTMLIKEHDTRYAERFDSSQQAIHVANESNRIRFETVNEWRTLVQGIIDKLMIRDEALSRFQQIQEKGDENARRVSERFDSMQQSFTAQMTAIERRIGAIENTRAGVSQGLGYIVTIIVVTGVIVGTVVTLIQ